MVQPAAPSCLWSKMARTTTMHRARSLVRTITAKPIWVLPIAVDRLLRQAVALRRYCFALKDAWERGFYGR